MANQAIALQARAPQSNILGGAIQQNAQMMNMMSQQRAAERQAAQAAQAMQLAQAKESREASAAEIDMAGKKIDFYTKRAGQTMTPEGYSLLLKDLDRDAPEIAVAFRANLPEANFDRNTLLRMVGSVSDNFRATYGPLETEVVQMEDGTYAVARTGGFGKPGVFEMEEYKLAPGGAPTQAPTSAFPTTAAPATDAQIDEAARKIIRGAGVGELGISAEDFDRAAARANQLSAGGGARMQPISMTAGPQTSGQPDLTAVVQDMMQTKQISQSNLQLMREMAGPDKDAQLAQILKANNIQIVPDAQPQMRSAVFRPGEDAAPQMQLAQAMEDYRPTGRPARGKPPMQSPMPGIYNVPTPTIRDVKAAETQGSEDVRVQTQPTITAKEERIRRVEKLRGELPRARADAQALIRDLDERIEAIDEFLRSPYRNSIIGAIEGRIPKILQTPARADAQALYDSIKDNTTLTRLLSDRSQTETGASPLGIVSDRDVDMVARGATRLTQIGTERKQEIEMMRLRDLMYETRQLAAETYNNTYREVLPETPELRLEVPWIAPTYEDKPKTKTPTRRAAPQQGWGKAKVVGD
jgi:hypothetical protein